MKMKNYEELEKEFEEKVEKLQASCKHEDVSDWIVEWWAIEHPTGWQTKVCKFCNKIVARKTCCATCGNELVEDVDVVKEVVSSWYCEECAPAAEAEEEKAMKEFEKIKEMMPNLTHLGKRLIG